MLLTVIALWVGLLSAIEVEAICPKNSTDYKVTSQAEADAINICEIFNGTLSIEPRNATNLISLPGIKHITGDLVISTNADAINQSGTSIFSMQSLLSIDGQLSIGSISNLKTLDFPTLSTVRQSFDIYDNPILSTVSFPNLTTVGSMNLAGLPLLIDLEFNTGLSNVTGFTKEGPGVYEHYTPTFTVQNTALVSLEGLLFRDISGLKISGNAIKNITLSLESLTCSKGSHDTFDVSENYDMGFSLPNLKTAHCSSIKVADLSAVNIPSLVSINGSVSFYNLSLDTLYAPSLISVSEALEIELGNMKQINLPALRNVSGFMEISNLPAVYLEDGIFLPNITNVQFMDITGNGSKQPYCQILNNQRCRGLFTGNYRCGYDEVPIDSDPNMCQYTYPAYGWTRAKKLQIGLSVSLGPLALIGFIWLVYHHIKVRKAEEAKLQAPVKVELASAEQLPKYSQHDDDSGAIPPYAPDAHHKRASEGSPIGDQGPNTVATQGTEQLNTNVAEPVASAEEDANSVFVSPLEETLDASHLMNLTTANYVPQGDARDSTRTF